MMNRRKYLAAVGAATSLGLAGCSGGTGGNNSSGGNGSGGNGSGGGSTEAASGGAETEMESGGDSTDTGGDTTESSDEEATETEGEDGSETETESDESGGEESTETSGGDDSGGSSSIEDSGDTDVSLQSADVADAYSLDSVAFYSEEFSSGVRGEVTNTSDSTISYTEIQVRFYDSDDTRLGEGLDNTTDLGGGETYAFDVPSLLTSDEVDTIASYTITVTDSAL
jgi:hypothetical protein